MRHCAVAIAGTGLLFAQPKPEPRPDVELGRRIFESQCAVCHGVPGTGGRGPALNRPVLNKAADDTALRKLIAVGSPPEMPGAWQISAREVASVAAFVRTLGRIPPEQTPGNAKRGEALYRAKGCAACHIIAGAGAGYGPELTAIGGRRNAAHLREALVNPSAFVADEFTAVEAVTARGATIQGIRANEDTFTIQIRDLEGRNHSFRKEGLKDLRILRGRSAMPSYAALMTEEADDLTAYLASLRGIK